MGARARPAKSTLLTVSVDPPMVTVLGSRSFHEQWVEFYAVLALQHRRDPAVFVTVVDIHCLRSWNSKKLDTVGKEITRHVNKEGLSGLVLSPPRGKTRAWRLAADPTSVELSPTAGAVQAWADAQVLVAGSHAAAIDAIGRLVQATLCLRRGNASEAHNALGGPSRDIAEPALIAWRTLTEGRAAFLYSDEDEEFETPVDALARSADAAARAVAARLRTYQAMAARYIDAERTRATLTKVVSDLELSGDIGSLGVMLNVLGVLERRAGAHESALRHLVRAAGLLGICGDYHTLQAVMYNAAKAYESLLAQQGRPPDQVACALLDLCITICREFHVGGDSALAEITRADWSLDGDLLDAGESWLTKARHILEVSEVSYDQAYYYQTRGRLRFLRGEPMRAVLRDMNAAIRMYGKVGDYRAQERADSLLRGFRKRRRE